MAEMEQATKGPADPILTPPVQGPLVADEYEEVEEGYVDSQDYVGHSA